MKKLKSLLAALLAVTMALTATACGNTDGQQEGGVSTSIDPSTVLEENSDVIHAFGGGSSGGGYYTISNVLSQYFTDNGFGNFIAQPTTGGAGSGDNAHAIRVFEACGMSIDDDIDAQYIGVNESSDQLKDGQIDGFINMASIPYSVVTELTMSGKGKLIGLTEEQVRR